MNPIQFTRRIFAAIGLLAILCLITHSSHAQDDGPRTIKIGRGEGVGTLTVGGYAIGSNTTGYVVSFENKTLNLRIQDARLRREADSLDGEKVWIEGRLSYEQVHNEAGQKGETYYALVVNVDQIRRTRSSQKTPVYRVSVQGQVSRNVIRFGNSKSLEWKISSDDDDVKETLDDLDNDRRKLVGEMLYDSKTKQWRMNVAGVFKASKED